MRLTKKELLLILQKLCPEGGYSKDPEISALQAKLSILLSMAPE